MASQRLATSFATIGSNGVEFASGATTVMRQPMADQVTGDFDRHEDQRSSRTDRRSGRGEQRVGRAGHRQECRRAGKEGEGVIHRARSGGSTRRAARDG